MIEERVRNKAFWLIDSINGKQIYRHYQEIKNVCENYESYRGIIDEKLEKILRYATNHVDLYKHYKNYTSINDFPIIDKDVITKAGQNPISNEYEKTKLIKMYTSGSSGNPFVSYQNRDKKNSVRASVIYFGELCNYKIGDRNVYLRVWSEENKKSRFSAFKQNLIMIDITKLDTEILEDIRNRFKKDKRISCVLGYPSTFEILATYCLNKNDNPEMFNIKTIISSAETLNVSTREKLKNLFGCQIVSRYANQENGILAQELLDEDFYVLNKGNYYFEFLKLDSDEKAEYGELARIIITDLNNYAMPMIRYDTKDIAIVGEHEQYGEVILSIYGRREDQIYDTEGMPISIGTVDYEMIRYSLIDQYQIVQNSKYEYLLRVVGAKAKYQDCDLIYTLKHIFGSDAIITIRHEDEILRLKSGKYKILVSNYYPSNKEELMKNTKENLLNKYK